MLTILFFHHSKSVSLFSGHVVSESSHLNHCSLICIIVIIFWLPSRFKNVFCILIMMLSDIVRDYSVWGLLRFSCLWIYVFNHIWRVFSHHFKYFCQYESCLSFWDYNVWMLHIILKVFKALLIVLKLFFSTFRLWNFVNVSSSFVFSLSFSFCFWAYLVSLPVLIESLSSISFA